MEPVTAGKSGWRRFLIPFLCWIIVTAVLIGWQYHRSRSGEARIRFAVELEGERFASHQALLNGIEFESGQVSGIGQKTLRIVARDAEPFETNLFVWYGGVSLGTIRLERSRGLLDIEVFPTPNRVSISGLNVTNEIPDCSRKTLQLPVGDYEIRCAFERFTLSRTTTVRRGDTTVIAIKPSLTSLVVDSDPSPSQFRLESDGPERISIESSTPAMLQRLPTGPYQLAVWRDDYRKVISLNLTADPTNRLTVRFEYATVTIASDPSGAEVHEGEKRLGTTPALFFVTPGKHNYRLGKEGYVSTNLNLQFTSDQSREVHVTLANVAFGEALERARSASSAVHPDYSRAISEVDKALEIKPKDDIALRLKRSILVNHHISNAHMFANSGEHSNALAAIDSALLENPTHKEAFELRATVTKAKEEAERKKAEADKAMVEAKAELRLNRPKELFQQITTRMPLNELFEEQTLYFNGSLAAVREAIARALERAPKWTILQNQNPDSDTHLIQCGLRGLGWRQNVVLVAGQTDNNDVTIRFKLFQFALAGKAQAGLSGISDDGYMPVHPQYALGQDASFIETRRSRAIREFKKRIEEELR
jgi:tetratricopeptide (TPR) repeat protein